MLKFLKKVNNLFTEEPHPKAIELEKRIQESKNKLIDEIHNEFYTEVDKLLEFAKTLKPLDTDKQELLDKANRLKKLEFVSVESTIEAKKEQQRLFELEKENTEKQTLKKAIEYFSNKYPLYKFITEDSVKKICEKYNLIYGEVQYYKGDVPDKNLKEIENFKINEKDKLYLLHYFSHYNESLNTTRYIDYDKITTKHTTKSFDTKICEAPLEIVAPSKDFNLTDEMIIDFKVSKINIPDPIVLQPVSYNRNKYYLIVTAWGQESSDPLVLNPKFN